MNHKKLTLGIVTAGSILVILSAMALSYKTLFDLYTSIGLFPFWLGLLFPLLFDLAEVTAATAVVDARLRGQQDRYAWGLVLVFTVLGVIANVAHAVHAYYTNLIGIDQAVLAVGVTSLFPLSVASVTHLLARVVTRTLEQQPAITIQPQPQPQQPQPEPEKPAIVENSQSKPATAERRKKVKTLLGEGLTQTQIAEQLGFHPNTINADVKAVRNGVQK